MKNIFKGYYRLDKEEFRTLWKNAIFIFDTNVLLNMYRYQTSTRDALFNIMEQLSERVWIPYHVGLEFQRNRLTVIAEQYGRYSKVRNIVNNDTKHIEEELNALQLKERHSHINPDKLLEGISSIKEKFIKELDSLEEKSISVSSNDEIRDRIDVLFKDKIGNLPSSQGDLDKLFDEGENRYKNLIPPGFLDSTKDEKKTDGFTYGGLSYKRKFGDLIIWKQIIQYAKEAELKDIILVTDDNKPDWWWMIDSSGTKTIGTRPELIDEIYRESGVERFYIYNPEGFLKYASDQLGAEVTEDAIKEVRDVSVARSDDATSAYKRVTLSRSAEKAAYQWLSKKYYSLIHHKGFPEFIFKQDNLKLGFEIIAVRRPRVITYILNDLITQSKDLVNNNEFFHISLIIVALDKNSADEMIKRVRMNEQKNTGDVRIIIGLAIYNEDGTAVIDFSPYDEMDR